MASPLAKGIIITVSVLVAAGIAAYESPQVREWVERSREKIAVALHSLGDDVHPRSSRADREDPSMREEQSEKAEERRRQMREEIMEKGRRMEERMKRRKTGSDSDSGLNEKRSPSFDSLVDDEGRLRTQPSSPQAVAESSAVETHEVTDTLRSRHHEQAQSPMHQSVDAPMLLRQLDGPQFRGSEPWESRYEQEMRNTWNLPLPEQSAAPSSHASESLINLTPTTEDFPDPEVSIPTASELEHPLRRTEYFSVPGSRTSHTMSEAGESDFYYAHPDQPLTPIEPRPLSDNTSNAAPGSSAASIAGSAAHVHASDFDSEDDFSELGDGIRTPASVWTDVGSTVSGYD